MADTAASAAEAAGLGEAAGLAEAADGGESNPSPNGDGGGPAAVGASTYRLLRGRLEAAASELAGRAEALNQRRIETYGAANLELVATERVRTDNNVVPRDIEAVGDQMVLAYNAQAGVRGELRPEDVFSVHHLIDDTDTIVLSPNPEGLAGSALDDDRFRRDFVELHTYFKDARVQQVYRRGDKLLAVFRTGTGVTDIRVLRWTVGPGGELAYADDRGDRDHRFPPHQDVEWAATTRVDHVANRYVAIDGRVFVDPLGGTLDLRLPDATDDGELLISERLLDADQSLQDCEISYALAGADLVLIRVLPYREQTRRHFVVNLLTRTALRLDALGQAFRRLPEGQGLIFPEGIYLRTGEVRTFDLDPTDMQLLEVVRSPNGEDVLYVFHQQSDGRSILLPYNLVRQDVTTPIWCHGYCLFDDGTMAAFREEPEPTRVHPVQIWSTPFCSDDWYADNHRRGGPLDRVGNPGLVAGIADALSLTRLVADLEPSVEVYGDLLGSAGRVLDTHHWIGDTAFGDLAAPVHDIRMAAEAVIDEFERLQEVRAAAAAAVAEATDDLDRFLDELRRSRPARTEDFIAALDAIRDRLGHLQTITEMREVDGEAVAALVARATDANDDLARKAAEHLASDGAFVHYHDDLAAIEARVPAIDSSVAAGDVRAELDGVADAMELVAATVGDLVVADPRDRTAVLEQVSGVLAELNRVRAALEGRTATLIEAETGAAFATELGLYGQTLAAVVARVDTPEACDDALARLLLQLEQLESSGPRTDAQLDELAARRDQLLETIGGKRQQLIDERQRTADRLVTAGARTLDRVADRGADLPGVDEVNGFFAADPMVGRVRSLVDQLRDLGEPVRADELQSRLGAVRDGALRAVRDRIDLYDGDAIRLGRHRFSVESRPRELTVVNDGDRLEAVLSGTDLRVAVDDPDLVGHRELWDRPLPSETPALYRAAFLAGDLLLDLLRRPAPEGRDVLEAVAGGDGRGADPSETALRLVRDAVDHRLDEGYDRGVHDLDAARLLTALAGPALAAGPLVTTAAARSRAIWAWARHLDDAARTRWAARGRAAAELDVGPEAIAELADDLRRDVDLAPTDARYLMAELVVPAPAGATGGGGPVFARPGLASARAVEVAGQAAVAAALTHLDADPDGTRALIAGYVARDCPPELVDDVVTELVTPELARRSIDVDLAVAVDGLAGQHPTISDGRLAVRVDELLAAVDDHRHESIPAHRAFTATRRAVLARLATTYRLDDLQPRVPEGFVRNQLIDRIYLPLIGDNLARQIGTVDDASGARSGLLMLLSPPGYGKTTLVDYVADRLGMALVKVSGPGLGHEVTSLDPARAPSATAAREIERINLAFALGSNVMLYLDDIQHTSPELLQRFISLCDAQRRIEGVIDGEATTFDLRGKRFAVVMAGNPYTESGERFRVPDMLANRADTYNLGDVVSGNDELFARSYLENALGANPILAPLVGRDRADLDELLRAGLADVDESRLTHAYSSAELGEVVAVIAHLRRVQAVVLAVNRQYIASAATDDRYRTEPPFLLQGSYRNMVRMASKLLPAMTEAEVEAIIDEHYLAESQSLTGAAEANLLKLDELRGRLDGAGRERWDDIVATFRRQQRLGGDDRDPTTRVVAAIEEVAVALRHGPSSTG